MVDFDPPDPNGPKNSRRLDETFPDSWDEWAKGDGSRPLPGEAEFVNRRDPLTHSQKWTVAILVGSVVLAVLIFFSVNFFVFNDSYEHSEVVSHSEIRKQTARAVVEAKELAEGVTAVVATDDHEVVKTTAVASVSAFKDNEDDEIEKIAATIKVVGLSPISSRGFDPEMDRIAAGIRIVPLSTSPVAVPLSADATQ